jgi:hypothetical protein
MRFFFPDSQDQIDPAYDFGSEQSPEFRVRQRDDRYAHEVLQHPSYTGLLVSKPIVDGYAASSGKYTMAQRHRLYRLGVRRFFRLDQPGWSISTMGDCGAFNYAREEVPPYSVDEVIDFYDGCGFDYGISIDHVILGFDETDAAPEVADWADRQRLTLELAGDFLRRAKLRHCSFEPVGVAQGWSPRSYAEAVVELQRMGYRYIALGGMVPLKTFQIEVSLRAVADRRRPDTSLHLLGITRCDQVQGWSRLGVASFDSTSPFRQAFKDDKDNYYTAKRNYLAIRVPQVEGNARLKAQINAGRIPQKAAVELEQRCLKQLAGFDNGESTAQDTLDALVAYGNLVEPGRDRRESYAEVLDAQPWKVCPCGICAQAGIQVVVFRGTERNKRRGFHNLFVFHRRLSENLERKARGVARPA